jgi:hypothetical protein
MNIIRGNLEPAEVAPADGVGAEGVSRRRVLGGLAALPVLVRHPLRHPLLSPPGILRDPGVVAGDTGLIFGEIGPK